MSKYNWKNIKGVGLGIVAFEATEHLANIISEVRECFDYVTIGLQRLSYHGDPIDLTDLDEIFRLRDEDHLVDTILEINLDTNKEPRVQETDKRNLLIQDIEDHGCSHALIIDSDEFYTKQSVLKALVEIDKNNYEMTYCQYANYYHDYKHFLVYPFAAGMYVPFITKTCYRFDFECRDFPLPSDPTRRYVRPFDKYEITKTNFQIGNINGYNIDDKWYDLLNVLLTKQPLMSQEDMAKHIIISTIKKIEKATNYKIKNIHQQIKNNIVKKVLETTKKHYTVEYFVFPWNIVRMHHFSCIRADIRKKFNDWSSKTCFQNYNDLIDKAVDTYNCFDENSTEQQTASLLFGTPGHQVYVRAWEKQYIHPKYDIKDRYKPVKKYKKIAVMNLASTNSSVHLFEELDKCCKETWAKDIIDGKYENIDYWTVIDTAETSHIDTNTHTIYIQTDYSKDNTQQLLSRWLNAFEILEKNKYIYDWVLRTNTSTWCNIPIINEFLANELDDSVSYTFKLYAAFWSTFNIYMSGAAMLWSTRNIRMLKNIVDNTSQDILDIALDDVMMSVLWRKRAENIGLSNPDGIFHSFCGTHLPNLYKNTNFNDVNVCIPMHQIKTWQNENGSYIKGDTHENRINNDIPKMRELQKIWESKKENIDIEKVVADLRASGLDKEINILKYSKKEWITNNAIPEEIKSIQPFATTVPLTAEVKKFLHQRAVECGYRKA